VTAVNDAPLSKRQKAPPQLRYRPVFSSANNRAITLSDPDDNDNTAG
jgi:hypothetical protein